MFDILKKEIDWGGRKLTLETGRIARQADGAVLATYGETTVLCTAVSQKEPKRGIDFFPLTVNYQEKSFAAGKIPGGFFKREGRPSEKETLTSRLIDRPIRPLFHPQFRNETQVICTVLCHDLENDPDVVALVGASAALTLSGVPFLGPIGGARVGYVDGEYVLNPQVDEMPGSALDLMVAGTQDGVLMVESEAQELTEEVMLGAVMFGHREIQPVIDAIIEMAETAAKEPWDVAEAPPEHAIVAGRVKDLADSGLREAYKAPDKTIRHGAIEAVKAETAAAMADDEAATDDMIGAAFKKLEKEIVRSAILDDQPRIDGRDSKTVPDFLRGGNSPPRPWQRALHPWRDPGSGCRHPGNRTGRANHRRP